MYAAIFPEGKYALVKVFQKAGHIVGMCGDGANDAPALRQAQMGIAVSTATDVAKSAAGIVLTTAGLGGIVDAVKEGRIGFQRVLTYTFHSVTKKLASVSFIAAGLLITGHAILTPMLIVIILLTGDFLNMSITADNVKPSPRPDKWEIGRLTVACVVLGACFLIYCLVILLVGKYEFRFGISSLQSLATLSLVFGGEATLYSLRERRYLWRSRPGSWVLVASTFDVLIISVLALRGIAMSSLPVSVVAIVFSAAIVFALLLDLVKVPLFQRLRIA